MAKYAQSRINVWNSELGRAEKIFASNISRLRTIVNKYVIIYIVLYLRIELTHFNRHFKNDSDAGQLMYIVSFLHKAMKRTQETKGIITLSLLLLYSF
jgi:hypothetical protein